MTWRAGGTSLSTDANGVATAAVRDLFMKYQDRILLGTDNMVLFKLRTPGSGGNIAIYPNDHPSWLWITAVDRVHPLALPLSSRRWG